MVLLLLALHGSAGFSRWHQILRGFSHMLLFVFDADLDERQYFTSVHNAVYFAVHVLKSQTQ